MSYIDRLGDLLSLSMGKPVLPKYIKGNVRLPDGSKNSVEILTNFQDSFTEEFGHPMINLFDLTSVDYQTLITKWFDVSQTHSNMLNLYFGALFNSQMYPRNQFIGYCHAIESYHRQKVDDNYLDCEEFCNVYWDLLTILQGDPSKVYPKLNPDDNLKERYNLSHSFRSSMEKGTLKYANEYSLRRRLKDIVREREDAIDGVPYNIINKEGEIADTRNYFSHYTSELEKKASHQTDELYKLTWGVGQLIEAVILHELGFDDDIINEKLQERYSDYSVL
jgi:hypothetical protein